MYTLYKITNRINKKSYIGITKLDILERLSIHVGTSKNPKYPIQYAIAKYGADNFVIESLITDSTKEYISNLEQPAIELHESHISKNGYNVAVGGFCGDLGKEANLKRAATKRNYSADKKQRLAKAQSKRQQGKTKENDSGRLAQAIAVTGNKFALGHKHTKQTKSIISATHKGKIKSDITRQRMSRSAIINNNGKRFNGMLMLQ